MKILLFSDIHGDWKALARLLETEADYYVCAGDLVTWAKSLERAGSILAARKGRVFLIPGNHESLGNIQQLCEEYGLDCVHEKTWVWEGYRFAALGYSNPTPFGTPGEYSEEELSSKLAALREFSPDVLICHCPPKGTALDRAGENRHFGSTAIANELERMIPRWFFCGHIHEAEGSSCSLGKDGKTIGVNVGKRGYLLELEELARA